MLCSAKSVVGQTRRFGSPTITSGLSPTSDIPGPGRHFAKGPEAVMALDPAVGLGGQPAAAQRLVHRLPRNACEFGDLNPRAGHIASAACVNPAASTKKVKSVASELSCLSPPRNRRARKDPIAIEPLAQSPSAALV